MLQVIMNVMINMVTPVSTSTTMTPFWQSIDNKMKNTTGVILTLDHFATHDLWPNQFKDYE